MLKKVTEYFMMNNMSDVDKNFAIANKQPKRTFSGMAFLYTVKKG